jgi:hypothetical protein
MNLQIATQLDANHRGSRAFIIPYVTPVVESEGPNRGTHKPRPNSDQTRRGPR